LLQRLVLEVLKVVISPIRDWDAVTDYVWWLSVRVRSRRKINCWIVCAGDDFAVEWEWWQCN
jgi:hypothetical protein